MYNANILAQIFWDATRFGMERTPQAREESLEMFLTPSARRVRLCSIVVRGTTVNDRE